MDFVAIIPARYASTRFPGKPLAILGGKMVIQRVYEQAAKVFQNVFVATDDIRIANAVESFGGKAIMTSQNHRSGTDRCYLFQKFLFVLRCTIMRNLIEQRIARIFHFHGMFIVKRLFEW